MKYRQATVVVHDCVESLYSPIVEEALPYEEESVDAESTVLEEADLTPKEFYNLFSVYM